jgi:hypothetical protein
MQRRWELIALALVAVGGVVTIAVTFYDVFLT